MKKKDSFKLCFDKEYVIVIKFGSRWERFKRGRKSIKTKATLRARTPRIIIDFQVDYSYHDNLHIYGILLFLPCNISIVNNNNNVGTYTHFWLIIDWIIQRYLNCVMQVLIIPINFVFGMNYEVCSYSYNYWRKKDNSEY